MSTVSCSRRGPFNGSRMKRRVVFFLKTTPLGSFASGCSPRTLKEFDLFAELMTQERLGFVFSARLDGREQQAFVLRNIEEELGIVLREVLGRLLEVRHKRSRKT